MIINPYRFAAAGGNDVSDPLHHWDLTDRTATAGGGMYDQGSASWGGFLDVINRPEVLANGAPDGATDCLDFVPAAGGGSDRLRHAAQSWDGGTNDMSVSMWVYHDNVTAADYQSLLGWRDGSGAGNRLTWVRVQTDTTFDHLEFRIYDENDVNDVAEDDSASGDLTAGKWYHYVHVWNSTTGVMDLYVGDTTTAPTLYATTTNGSIGDLDTTDHEFVLGSGFGASIGLSSASLDGRMYAVAIYNYPLSASDITFLHNSGDGRTFSQL